MKQLYLFIIVLSLVLGGCAPGQPSEGTLPPTQEVHTGIDYVSQNTNKVEGPRGSYILVRFMPTGAIGTQQIFADLFFNGHLICTWDLNQTAPWDRGESELYFVSSEDNCPEMGTRNAVTWHVTQNWAELFFENKVIEEIPIWTQSGVQLEELKRK